MYSLILCTATLLIWLILNSLLPQTISKNLLYSSITIFVILNALDVHSTRLSVLKEGSSIEGNEILRYLFSRYGFWKTIILMKFFIGGLMVTYAAIYQTVALLLALNILLLLAVINNYYLLFFKKDAE